MPISILLLFWQALFSLRVQVLLYHSLHMFERRKRLPVCSAVFKQYNEAADIFHPQLLIFVMKIFLQSIGLGCRAAEFTALCRRCRRQHAGLLLPSIVANDIAAASGHEIDILIAVRIVDQRAQAMGHAQIRLISQLGADLQLIGDHLCQPKEL